MNNFNGADSSLIMIDNYDSFTYNLVQYLGELGEEPQVFRNDAISLSELRELRPEGIVISPGPGNPEDPRYLGISRKVLQVLSKDVPTLGVCLGHQAIGVLYGGIVKRAPQLFHGKTSIITHEDTPLFEGIPERFPAARYHSLILDPPSLPDQIKVTARTENGEIMALEHRQYPMWGVQFHPESVLAKHGKKLLANFLKQIQGG